MRRAEVTSINLITPDNPHARTQNTFVSFALFALAAATLTLIALQHLRNETTINSLNSGINHANAIANPPSGTLREYQQTRAGLEETTEELQSITSALPQVVNWPDVITRISSKLPGVNTLSPQITLTSLHVTTTTNSTPFDYGVSSTRSILSQAQLKGTATNKNAVADAIIQFEEDPDFLYRFPGTTINGEHYDFTITVALLGEEPNSLETEPDRGTP